VEEESILKIRKFVAPEYVFGPGSIKLAGRYAENLGMEKVLVVTDPGVVDSGWVDAAEASLRERGLESVRFTDVSPNPRDRQVMQGAKLYDSAHCDGILAVGGGSPMDCAKGIGIVSKNRRHVTEFEGVDMVPFPGPPLICVPTTSGSSADVSQFAIINDTSRKVKIAIVSKTVVPDASLLDPAATVTMDRDLTINTGLDAMTHAVEAYVSNAGAPTTDLFSLEAVRLLGKYLPKAPDRPGDILIRSKVMLASLYAGLAFSNAILGAVHAMAHSLGGLLDLPHGQCNAILLDHVMERNFMAAPERYANIGRMLGQDVAPGESPDKAKALTIQAVKRFKAEPGMTATLGDLGVSRQEIPGLAAKACNDPCMATNPLHLEPQDIEEIFENAL